MNPELHFFATQTRLYWLSVLSLILLLSPGTPEINPGGYIPSRQHVRDMKDQKKNSNIHLVFPVYDECNWAPVDYKNLRCPIGSQTFPGLENPKTFKIPISRPYYQESGTIPGYLCTKYRLSTTCESNWMAVEEVTHTTHLQDIKLTECLAKVNARTFGTDPEFLEHPLKQCTWTKTETSTIERVVIEQHPVMYDPYRGKYVDPIFPGGAYFGTGTITNSKSKAWIPAVPDRPEACKHEQNINSIVYIPNMYEHSAVSFKEHGKIWTDITREKSFTDACVMTFCQKEGIRFPDGELFFIVKADFVDSQFIIMQNSLPTCAEETIVKLQDPFEEGHFSSSLGMAQIFLMKCHETISKLRNRDPVSQVDISYLSQSYPGHGLAYKWYEGTLTSCLVNYVVGALVDKDRKIILSHGGTKSHTPGGYVYRDWSQSTVPGTLIGPNGILNISGTLEIPFDNMFREFIHSELTQETGYHNVSHHELKPIIDSLPDDINWHEHPNNSIIPSDKPGIIGYVKGSWHTWQMYLYIWGVLMMMGGIIYIFVAYPEVWEFFKITFLCMFGWIYYVPKVFCLCCCKITSAITDRKKEQRQNPGLYRTDHEQGLDIPLRQVTTSTNRALMRVPNFH